MFGGMNNYGTNPDAEMKKRAQMASLGSLADGLLQAGFAGNDWSKFGQGIAGGVRGMGDAYKKSLMEDEQLRYQRGQRDYQMDAQADEKKNRKEQMEDDDAMDEYNTTALPALQESAAKVKQMIMESQNIPEEQKQGIISKGEFLLNRAIKGTYKDSDGKLKIVPKAVEDLQKFVDETGVLVGNSALREMLNNETQEKTIGNQGYLLEDPNGSIEVNGKRYKADIDAWTKARQDRDQSVIALRDAKREAGPSSTSGNDGKPSDSESGRIRNEIYDDLQRIVNAGVSNGLIQDDKVSALAQKYGYADGEGRLNRGINKLREAWNSDPTAIVDQLANKKLEIGYPGLRKPNYNQMNADVESILANKKDPPPNSHPVADEVRGSGPTTGQILDAISKKGKDEVIRRLIKDGMSQEEATALVNRLAPKG